MSEEDLYDFVHRLAVRHDASYIPGAFADPSDLLDYFMSIVPGEARMCALESKTTTAITCRCLHQRTGESVVCDHGIVTSVDSQDPLSHHVIKLFSLESVCGFRCDQCNTVNSGEPSNQTAVSPLLPTFSPGQRHIPPDFGATAGGLPSAWTTTGV